MQTFEVQRNIILHLHSESTKTDDKPDNFVFNNEKLSENQIDSSASFSCNLSPETTVVLESFIIRIQDVTGVLHADPIQILIDRESPVSIFTLSYATKLG